MSKRRFVRSSHLSPHFDMIVMAVAFSFEHKVRQGKETQYEKCEKHLYFQAPS
jgi:hypothetical protein